MSWLNRAPPLTAPPVVQTSTSSGVSLFQAFSPALTFTANTRMARYQVTGALAFTKDLTGAVPDTRVTVELVANGTNVPTFSGFKEMETSTGYTNTAGYVNTVRFVFNGVEVVYAIEKLKTPVAAVRLSSIAGTTGTSTITLAYNQTLNSGSTPAASAFTIAVTGGGSALTTSSVSVSGSNVVLTTSRVLQASDAITVTYVPPTTNAIVASASGEFAGGVYTYAVIVTVAGKPINTVAPAVTYPGGLLSVGNTLTTTTGTWTSNPSATITQTYQWYYGDTLAAIPGATASTYTVVSGDVGHTLYCAVTGTNIYDATVANSNTTTQSALAAAFAQVATSASGFTTTANGSGYNYGTASNSSATNLGNGAIGVFQTKLAAATTVGAFQVTYGGRGTDSGSGISPDGILVGLRVDTTPGSYGTIKYGTFITVQGGQTKYQMIVDGQSNTAPNVTPQPVITFSDGDIIRMRKAGTGSNSNNLYAELSKDGGVTFAAYHNFGNYSNADLYATVITTATQQAVLPRLIAFT